MKGEKVTLTITGTGMDGEGVARLDDLAVFVPGALLNETVEAIVYERKKNYARARVIKVLTPSTERVEPICPVYYRCGGCTMQHVNYTSQLRLKRAEVADCLKKQLKRNIEVGAAVASDKTFGYRNKLQLPIGEANGRIIAGFYKENSHSIVPIESCPLHGEWADIIIGIFLHFANEYKLTAYNEVTGKGLLRHLVVRRVGEDNYSIVIVINGDKLPQAQILADRLGEKFYGRFTLHYSVNRARNNVIMGDNIHTIYGKDRIITSISGLTVSVSPLSFMQINDYIRDRIYSDVVSQLRENDIVIDAYSGAGIMTALAARKSKGAIGIEIVKEAVEDADALMQANDLIDCAVNIYGDTAEILPRLTSYLSVYGFNPAGLRSDVDNGTLPRFPLKKEQEKQFPNLAIIVDPPRKGCSPEVINSILLAVPSKILYVSCNPATLARDLALLTADNRYDITSVTPYDMFPETGHVETLISLVRK